MLSSEMKQPFFLIFPIPVGYEEYLSKMYGDYMKLPKEEDRVFHDFEGYIK